VRRRGENDVLSKADAKLEETAYDRQRIARASLPTRGLPPGDYTLSAVISIDGQPAGRVSRAFIMEPGSHPAAASVVPSPEATPTPGNPPTSTRITDPILEPVMHKTAAYVAGYGEQMSAVIGVENYTQQVNPSGSERPMPPRQIVAEFALVKSGGPIPWSGFRDVVEVNGTPVSDRKDRILRILADSANPIDEAARLTAESARFNIGPVSRNFNLPTTALFFFHESNLGRFTFTRKGTKKIDGVDTLEVAFRETARPTLITTRAGKDVPCEGTLWVIPETGAIVRTRLQLKGFADALAVADSKDASGRPAPPTPPPVVTSAPSGTQGAGSTGARPTGSTAGDANAGALRSRFGDFGNPGGGITQLESTAEIEVTYRRDEVLGMWLPARMSEEYQGTIPRISNVPLQGTSHSTATYSDYKRFGTSATIVGPKKDQ
jgi:hypothetical protein